MNKENIKYYNNVEIVDCTLRDGGYYNLWDFDVDLINDYLEVMDKANIGYVEIGFRSLKRDKYRGPLAYCTEDYLAVLNIPKGLTSKIAVMINASEIIKSSLGFDEEIDNLFVEKKESKISLVRIACLPDELTDVNVICNLLKNKGYTVAINIMQIAKKEIEEIEKIISQCNLFSNDILYFADSMGSLSSIRNKHICECFVSKSVKKVGIHAHDNIGLAFHNSISAFENNFNYIDATLLGMGRGAGNCKLEDLVMEISNLCDFSHVILDLINLIEKYFVELKNKYMWGSNLYYFWAGKKNIHPTYIQEMLSDKRYDSENILSVLEHIKYEERSKYNVDTIRNISKCYWDKPISTWKPIDIFSDKVVLFLGAGSGIKKHKLELETFIKKVKPLVISFNLQTELSLDYIDLFIACHPIRLMADCKKHKLYDKPLITPFSMLPFDIKNELSNKKIYDFGISVHDTSFNFDSDFAIIPNSLVLSYALSTVTCGNASKIYLAGFDGYEDSVLNKEVDDIFLNYKDSKGAIKDIISITPTMYNIKSLSVYTI